MRTAPEMARVLVVDDDPASRLTLKTLLCAGGYTVDCAASAAEAYGKLDERQYSLVLSDAGMEAPESGSGVLAHARGLHYRPATAVLRIETSRDPEDKSAQSIVETEDVPGLLTRVADLISRRAERRIHRHGLVASAAAR